MRNPFQIGDTLEYTHTVTEADVARFPNGLVHPVYSTFSISRDAEWACRLFVLEMKEEDEEGIGTMLEINHQSPALLGSKIRFVARLESVEKNAVICSFVAYHNERVVASGRTGQKILKKSRLEQLFSSLS